MKPIYKLPNVEVWDTNDMRPVYAVTDILLVPNSLRPLVGSSSKPNGIPVVAVTQAAFPTLGQEAFLVEPKTNRRLM